MITPKAFQLFDSSLPIGSFTHSLGVEEAYMRGYEIKSFIRDIFENVILRGDVAIIKIAYENPAKADELLYASKLPKEIKNASIYMGVSLANLNICHDEYVKEVRKGLRKGTYPVIVARCCKSLGIRVEDCMAGLAYSELAQMVFSAVRLRAIDFIEGQKLIAEILDNFTINVEFEPFSPILDILSKLHENREVKVFMS